MPEEMTRQSRVVFPAQNNNDDSPRKDTSHFDDALWEHATTNYDRICKKCPLRIAHDNGGASTIENLRPMCHQSNMRMGNTHMSTLIRQERLIQNHNKYT